MPKDIKISWKRQMILILFKFQWSWNLWILILLTCKPTYKPLPSPFNVSSMLGADSSHNVSALHCLCVCSAINYYTLKVNTQDGFQPKFFSSSQRNKSLRNNQGSNTKTDPAEQSINHYRLHVSPTTQLICMKIKETLCPNTWQTHLTSSDSSRTKSLQTVSVHW